jgi:glycogen debranching enzyme
MATDPEGGHVLQPLLHDLVSTVRAPASALSGPDGQIRPVGVQGVFHADARVLDRAVLRVDDREADAVAHAPAGPGVTSFVALARWLGDRGPDPTVRVTRTRRMAPAGLEETVTVSSTASEPLTCTVTLEVGCDLAAVDVVKSGRAEPSGGPEPLRAGGNGWRWAGGGTVVVVTGDAAAAAEPGWLRWPVALAPGGSVELRWRVKVTDTRAVIRSAGSDVEWARPAVVADDRRLARLLSRSLDDLESLRLRLTAGPDDTFVAAGVPWFLTLFGRDSLWTARMLLPLGTDVAAGTLRVLAARQGRSVDKRTGEEPGKILHELRRHNVFTHQASDSPFAYYGSVDATLLWICVLHDAWRWGMPPAQVAELLPALEAALEWLGTYADGDGDGFVEYIDHSGHGLANQGWKDSGDSVRFRSGRIAAPPIALAEVQGYAHEAALAGAALLDAFARPGADRWRSYAADLAERFRTAFWVDSPAGTHPALALDGEKKPVDSLTSNIGHLLGTGILTPAEEAVVADLLGAPALAGGFGLRTMSTNDAAFSPLSYHCGSVWSHDTAIVIDRLARAGFTAPAATLASGLLAAAEAFDYQLPELFGGDDRAALGRPVPYPAACRPQAWAAAAGVTLLHAAVGLRPDVPAGTVTVAPLAGAPLGAVSVAGLRVAGAPVTVSVDATGAASVSGFPASLVTA